MFAISFTEHMLPIMVGLLIVLLVIAVITVLVSTEWFGKHKDE